MSIVNFFFKFKLSDRIPARLVLYFLSWSGFLVSFMMRNDINFALVAMVKDKPKDFVTNENNSTLNGNVTQNLYSVSTIDLFA